MLTCDPAPSHAIARAPEPGRTSSRRQRILCIEDERETAALIREDLEERGFDVELAFDGQSGLSSIVDRRPDLILCDISLPLMSGFEVLERLAAMTPSPRDVPFLFLTALSDRDTELKGRQLGADDYVTKPLDFDLLAAIIDVRLVGAARRGLGPGRVTLSRRESEALTWSARGKTSDEIALILGVAKRTVDFHIDNARGKLGVATRIQAVVKAVTWRLIEP